MATATVHGYLPISFSYFLRFFSFLVSTVFTLSSSLSLSLSSLLRLPAGNASTDQFISPLVPVSRVYASLNDGN